MDPMNNVLREKVETGSPPPIPQKPLKLQRSVSDLPTNLIRLASRDGADLSWFHGRLSREAAESLLASHPSQEGLFLVRQRLEECRERPFGLSLKQGSKVYHVHIRKNKRGQLTVGKAEKPDEACFWTLESLIKYYQTYPLYLLRRSGESLSCAVTLLTPLAK